MVYLVSGNAADRKEYIHKVITKQGGDPARAVRITPDDLTDREIHDVVVTQSGLFGDKEFYILQDLARTLPLRELLSEYAESHNEIFFSEETVTKKITQEFERVNAEHHVCSPEEKKVASGFNIFSLTDALGKRDKKNLWLLYQEARDNASSEEILGVLMWQAKNMVMVAASPTGVPEMKPFVLKKNQGFIKNYSRNELTDMVTNMVTMFHNRDVYNTVDVQIERFILSL